LAAAARQVGKCASCTLAITNDGRGSDALVEGGVGQCRYRMVATFGLRH
jgi:hypothetical protein